MATAVGHEPVVIGLHSRTDDDLLADRRPQVAGAAFAVFYDRGRRRLGLPALVLDDDALEAIERLSGDVEATLALERLPAGHDEPRGDRAA